MKHKQRRQNTTDEDELTQEQVNPQNENIPEVQQYVLQMEQQQHMLEQQVHQQQEEIAYLKYQQAWQYHQVEQRPAHNIQLQLSKSMARPEVFHGNTGDDLDSWLAQMINYIKLVGIPQDKAAQWSSTYLKGPAWTWFSSLTAEQMISITNLDSFVAAMTRRFKPLDNQHVARLKLQTLVQTTSVTKFNEIFNSLMQQLPKMDLEDRKFQYIQRLKDNIQTALAASVKPDHTLHEIQLTAMKIDITLFQQRGKSNNNTMVRNGGNAQYSKPTWSAQPRPVVAANVTNIHTTPGNEQEMNNDGNISSDDPNTVVHLNNIGTMASVPKLTPEMREHCRKNRLCFRCRRSGHMSISCPTFTNTSNSIRPSAPLSKK